MLAKALMRVRPTKKCSSEKNTLTVAVLGEQRKSRLYFSCSISCRSERTELNACRSRARSSFSGEIEGRRVQLLHSGREILQGDVHERQNAPQRVLVRHAPEQLTSENSPAVQNVATPRRQTTRLVLNARIPPNPPSDPTYFRILLGV